MATRGIAIDRIIRPFERFFQLEASSSIVLLIAAVVALAWANSPFHHSYEELWHTPLSISIGPFSLEKGLLHWVNDGLMAIFFLLVGLEVKREFLMGKLSNPRAAAFPIVAAIGGMVIPALIYVALNLGTDNLSGWGVPMATDIAFALGVLALIGRGLPPALRVFLAAFAIVDDLGAVLVIALFYTPGLNLMALAIAGAVFLVLIGVNQWGVRSPTPYLIIGVVLWLAVLKSGVHATIAGVLLALTIPARLKNERVDQLANVKDSIRRAPAPAEIEYESERVMLALSEGERQAALLAVEKAAEREEAPLTRLEHSLAPAVAFGIMPVFAFANAGVHFTGDLLQIFVGSVSMGIFLGLVIGKQLGIFLFAWLAVKFRMASLPIGSNWTQVYGAAWLGGIGFTVALFIAGLAFPPDLAQDAKLGIFIGSFVSGVGGMIILRRQGKLAIARAAEASAR